MRLALVAAVALVTAPVLAQTRMVRPGCRARRRPRVHRRCEPNPGPLLFASGEYEKATLLDGLGETFCSERLSFKRWPACRGTHAYIEAALTLREQVDWRRIARVEVVVGEGHRMPVEPPDHKQATSSPPAGGCAHPGRSTAYARRRVAHGYALVGSSYSQGAGLSSTRCRTRCRAGRQAGASGMLAQAYVQVPGHCTFTAGARVAAVEALDGRIATGRWDVAPGTLNRLAGAAGAGRYLAYRPARFLRPCGPPAGSCAGEPRPVR